MPRYFFNIHDGSSLVDSEGTELPDLAAARIEATRLSGAVIKELGAPFWDHCFNEWLLEVNDGSGQTLLRLRLSGERVN